MSESELTRRELEEIEARRRELPAGPVVDRDNPEWSDRDFAEARPPEEVLPPEILAQFPNTKRAGRPKAEAAKEHVSLRLAPDVLGYWKAKGKGWQSLVEAALRRTMEEERRAENLTLRTVFYGGSQMSVLMIETKDFPMRDTLSGNDFLIAKGQRVSTMVQLGPSLEVLGRELSGTFERNRQKVRVSGHVSKARIIPK